MLSVCKSAALSWLPGRKLPTTTFEPTLKIIIIIANIIKLTQGIRKVNIFSALTEYLYTSAVASFILAISLSSRTNDFTTRIAVKSSCTTEFRLSYFLNIILKWGITLNIQINTIIPSSAEPPTKISAIIGSIRQVITMEVINSMGARTSILMHIW